MKLINFVSPLHFKKYRYRCAICNKDLLVNKTIVDTGIGMAIFNNEYCVEKQRISHEKERSYEVQTTFWVYEYGLLVRANPPFSSKHGQGPLSELMKETH